MAEVSSGSRGWATLGLMRPGRALTHTDNTVRRRRILALGVALLVAVMVAALPAGTAADQGSDPVTPAAGGLDAGSSHTCALLPEAGPAPMRCWGFSAEGELGYGNKSTIGDDETPAAAGPVDFGEGREVAAFSAGDFHTCALLGDATVRCWGFGGNGRLGYGNQRNIGDDETPASVGPVDLGAGRSAAAIAAGGSHTCALLDNRTVRCWGFAFWGELGYGNPPPDPETPDQEPDPVDIGDNELPGEVGPVNLGGPAKAITAGDLHTCALLNDGTVRCWGQGTNGQLGYGNENNVGHRRTNPPAVAGPVDLGPGRTATAISAGAAQTCAVLDDGNVRCWGFGGNGRLGYGNTSRIGDSETPGSVAPVDLGAGRTAKAIGVGDGHACALLDDASVRCWGFNIDGRLGYGHTVDIGDDETPGSAGPVDLGGRGAVAIALGRRHTCARLDDGNVRCWGYGANGRLGLCSERNVGDNETPGSAGPVDLGTLGSGAPACAPAPPGPTPGPTAPPAGPATPVDPLEAEKARARAFRSCLRRAARHTRRELGRARRLSGSRRARAKRHLRSHRSRLRRACLKRHGRKPGRVTELKARAVSRTRVVLEFNAPGTDGANPPAARTYLVKQSRRRIRGSRGFRRAQTLCKGTCRFPTVTSVGAKITLKVGDLRPHTTYYYAVAARDNVSRRLGRRSTVVKVRTR